MNNNVTKNDEIEIDLFHIFRLLWGKIWIIIISMVLLASLTFSYATFFVTPMYRSSAKMYVNNSNISLGGTSFSISSSELTAAKSLLEVYVMKIPSPLDIQLNS